jgi:hypothetical protein
VPCDTRGGLSIVEKFGVLVPRQQISRGFMFERLVEIKFELTDGRGLGSTDTFGNRMARDGTREFSRRDAVPRSHEPAPPSPQTHAARAAARPLTSPPTTSSPSSTAAPGPAPSALPLMQLRTRIRNSRRPIRRSEQEPHLWTERAPKTRAGKPKTGVSRTQRVPKTRFWKCVDSALAWTRGPGSRGPLPKLPAARLPMT